MRSIKLFMIFIVLLAASFMITSTVSAQYWQAMPPYNVLWPLWSDVLSPNISGIPTPIVDSLTRSTQLPVMPVFVWDIGPNNAINMPYFLYNTPPILGGDLIYWEGVTGFGTFPPTGFISPTGGINPNPLPIGYDYLIPDSTFSNFDLLTLKANTAYQSFFGPVTGAVPFFDLIPGDELWGSPPPLFPDFLLW